MFGQQFYPTPDSLIRKMLKPYHFRSLRGLSCDVGDSYSLSGRIILEPSAGKGNIVDFIKGDVKLENIYCIEKDENLSLLLQKKGYKVIGNDFLCYAGDYFFDMIIMNPPFNEGSKHLLKAWERLIIYFRTPIINNYQANYSFQTFEFSLNYIQLY